MKTEPRRFRNILFQASCGVIIAIAVFFLPAKARADGCFVVPKFVWDKHKDINEPTQKAIIAYDAGHEDLVLQVKYDGPVEEFGWLIPVPNLPTIKEGSMECFYELSKFTQKKFDYEARKKAIAEHVNGDASAESEPPLKVIEIKTVGAYNVTVLSTKDAGALEGWLKANNFAVPPDQTGVIDSYVKQGWYFVAARINASKAAGFTILSGSPKNVEDAGATLKEKMASGELHPLQIGFASEKCVFPLKISSIGGQPSELQLYVLSVEPLVERKMWEQKLIENQGWRSNELATLMKLREQVLAISANRLLRPKLPEPDYQLSSRCWINDKALFPYAQTGSKELPECSRRMSLPVGKQVWLTKVAHTFKPEEMRDLEFVPAIAEFSACLNDSEGAFAAAELATLDSKGASALLAAMKTGNPVVRAHATAVFESLSRADLSSRFGGDWDELLPMLLKDADPEVRLHAIDAAMNTEDARFLPAALDLLRDSNEEINDAARGYLRQHSKEAAKYVPMFHQMLKDTNPIVQMSGLQLLFNSGVKIPREEVLPLLSVPRLEVAALAFQILQPEGISWADARPLMENPVAMVRLLGLRVLEDNKNKDSVEFSIPLLKDSEPFVRTRAHDLLTDLTGQNIPLDQPGEWEKWWQENRAAFVLDPQQMAQRREQRRRQLQEAIIRRNTADNVNPEP